MDGNAHPHRAKVVQERLACNEINHLPPLSPDLNCIEHAWDMLGRALIAHQPPVQSVRLLRQVLPHLWDAFDQNDLDYLILGMPRRVEVVIAHRGGITRYEFLFFPLVDISFVTLLKKSCLYILIKHFFSKNKCALFLTEMEANVCCTIIFKNYFF